MKNYRTEIIAFAFLGLLMLSILLTAPWREQPPGSDAFPTPATATLTPATTPATVAVAETATDTPAPALEGSFPRCAAQASGLCLVSAGVDALNGNTVFSLNIRNTDLADLYLLVSAETSNRYECQAVESLPGVLYCAGPFISAGTQVNIEVYTRLEDRLLKTGSLVIPGPPAPEANQTATPAYPSYPSYP